MIFIARVCARHKTHSHNMILLLMFRMSSATLCSSVATGTVCSCVATMQDAMTADCTNDVFLPFTTLGSQYTDAISPRQNCSDAVAAIGGICLTNSNSDCAFQDVFYYNYPLISTPLGHEYDPLGAYNYLFSEVTCAHVNALCCVKLLPTPAPTPAPTPPTTTTTLAPSPAPTVRSRLLMSPVDCFVAAVSHSCAWIIVWHHYNLR
jgi:hypothetical protein